MKDQILRLIKEENLTSAKFAEMIEVQPSSISHVLSGRNKPSYDFILKVLSKFPNVNSDWILFGKGSMYKTIKQQSLFNDVDFEGNSNETTGIDTKTDGNDDILDNIIGTNQQIGSPIDKSNIDSIQENKVSTVNVEKIVIFYSDKTFIEYKPR